MSASHARACALTSATMTCYDSKAKIRQQPWQLGLSLVCPPPPRVHSERHTSWQCYRPEGTTTHHKSAWLLAPVPTCQHPPPRLRPPPQSPACMCTHACAPTHRHQMLAYSHLSLISYAHPSTLDTPTPRCHAQPGTLSFASLSAPAASSLSTTSTCPWRAACTMAILPY